VHDAGALLEGGFDGLLLENFGDLPFPKGSSGPVVAAAMGVLVADVRRLKEGPLGVNVLRNDAQTALAAAVAGGADFIRVNIHTHAALTDQGFIEGRAEETLRMRRMLGSGVAILADVAVKHGLPLPPIPLERLAADTAARGLADALLVTGEATGRAPEDDAIRRVRDAVEVPVLVASGLTPENVSTLLPLCDGAIVASCTREGGRAGAPVDPERVRRFIDAARASLQR
jgi:membrane complex biogenesis BtpA family protein